MSPLPWFLVSLLFLLAELAVPGGVYFACLAAGALAATVAAGLGLAVASTGLVFFGATTLAVFAAAPAARRWMRRIPRRPVGVEALAGQRGRVVESLDPGTGQGLVELPSGSRWLALSETAIAAGAWVEVVNVTGVRLRVRPCSPFAPFKE